MADQGYQALQFRQCEQKMMQKEIVYTIFPGFLYQAHFQLLTEEALLKVSRVKMRIGRKKGE